jgi:methylmalonyl-CoA mutase, C-terminal domain
MHGGVENHYDIPAIYITVALETMQGGAPCGHRNPPVGLLRTSGFRLPLHSAVHKFCWLSPVEAVLFPASEVIAMAEQKIRVLVAKPGLDGHDRGAKVIASALRDAGMEVIYTGLHQTPEMVVSAAIQEDVDVVAMSILSGAHMTLFPKVRELLAAEGADHVLLTGGGIIPEEDMQALKAKGIGRLFGPGTTTTDAVAYIRDWYAENGRDREAVAS